MTIVTLDNFLANLTKSNLLATEQLQKVRSDVESHSDQLDPKQLAQQLVQEQLLTRWQAGILLAGRTAFFLGKYKLLRELGRGGMGAVFQAEQRPLGRIVALKVMSPSIVKDQVAITRFHREIQAAAALQHPNIVAALDADNVQNTHFLVMEFVEGIDLSDIAKQQQKLPAGTACEYIRQAALGLQHAYERGMVHRDIKPSNLLLTWRNESEPVVKILDMGLARFTSDSQERQEKELTKTGQVMGTPDYISPEQARDSKSADIRSDIFSLGCSLYRLVSGQVPYTGSNVMEKLIARSTEDAPLLRTDLPEASPELEMVVAKMLAREPDQRYQIPAEVVEALTPFASFSATVTQPAPAQPIESTPLPADDPSISSMDAGLGQFMHNLATEAAEEVSVVETGQANSTTTTDQTQNLQITRGGLKLQSQIEQRKRAEKRRLLLILAGMAACIGLVVGYVFWQQAGETTLVVDLGDIDRSGVTLEVDGITLNVPKKGSLSVPGSSGQRTVSVRRTGYKPVSKKFTFDRGQTQTFEPEWKPTDETIRILKFAILQKRFDRLRNEWKKSEVRLPDPSDVNIVKLREDLIAFRMQYPGTDLAINAAKLMSQLPWPIDKLKLSDSDQIEIEAAKEFGDNELPKGLVGIIGNSRVRHWGEARTIALNSDGSILAVASSDSTVSLWNTTNGNLIQVIHPFQYFAGGVSFSPDDKFIAMSNTHGVKLWDLSNNELVWNTQIKDLTVRSVRFHPDGKTIFIDAETIAFLNAETGKLYGTIQGYSASYCSGFSTDGSRFATNTAEKEEICIWDTETREIIKRFSFDEGFYHYVSLHPSGNYVASIQKGKTPIVWNIETGEVVHGTDSSWLDGSPIFSPDGKKITISSGEKTNIRDLQSGNLIQSYTHQGPHNHMPRLAYSSNGKVLAVEQFSKNFGIVRICDLHANQTRKFGTTFDFDRVAVNPSGESIALSTSDGDILIWNVSSRKTERRLSGIDSSIAAIWHSPDGKLLAAVTKNLHPMFWKLPEGERITAFREGDESVYSLAFSPDGHFLATGDDKRVLRLWNINDREMIRQTKKDQFTLHWLEFSPDAKMLVTTGSDGSSKPAFQFWNTNSGELNFVLGPLDDDVAVSRHKTFSISPLGRTLIARYNGYAKIWEIEKKRVVRTFGTFHSSVAEFPAFSEDFYWITPVPLTVIRDHMRFGGESTGVQLGPLYARVNDIALTPDGRHIITANGNGTVYILRLKEWSANMTSEE